VIARRPFQRAGFWSGRPGKPRRAIATVSGRPWSPGGPAPTGWPSPGRPAETPSGGRDRVRSAATARRPEPSGRLPPAGPACPVERSWLCPVSRDCPADPSGRRSWPNRPRRPRRATATVSGRPWSPGGLTRRAGYW